MGGCKALQIIPRPCPWECNWPLGKGQSGSLPCSPAGVGIASTQDVFSPMGQRSEPRLDIQVPVRVLGSDASGQTFSQNVSTVTVSSRGVSVRGLTRELKLGDTVGVVYKTRKTRYRVMWMGKPESELYGQAGLQCLTSDCIWDFPLPPPGDDSHTHSAGAAGERRKHPRIRCSASIEMHPEGDHPRVMGSVSDLSLGGCFVVMPIPLKEGTRLKAVLWLKETKVTAEALVSGARPGFGMGLRFTDMDEQSRNHLDNFLRSQPGVPFQKRRL